MPLRVILPVVYGRSTVAVMGGDVRTVFFRVRLDVDHSGGGVRFADAVRGLGGCVRRQPLRFRLCLGRGSGSAGTGGNATERGEGERQ